MLCPACDLEELILLADLGEMPVACGQTFASAADARQSPRGRMCLGACNRCGHVANVAFDPELGRFDASFEAALFHSPTYTAYATSVVERLVKRYELEGKKVLEVASGSHVLLERLTELGCVASGTAEPLPGEGDFDLVLARFVLEHMADPAALLTGLRGVAKRAFFEVPDAAYDLTTAGWDCIYPHVGYFGAPSLLALCERTGWRLVDMGTAFHDQYLWAEVEAALPCPPKVSGHSSDHQLSFTEATQRWQATLPGKRAVVWGAGTRGTMFCNRVDPQASLLLGVVDRNPAKQGRFLPLTGHPVLAAQELQGVNPDMVILTNPAYRTEIAAELAGYGLTPELLVA